MPNARYFSDPVYGLPTAQRGGSGTQMDVVLGPTAVDTVNYGSRTGAASIPTCMVPLNAKDYVTGTRQYHGVPVPVDRGLWVAGHLLNDNMGGSGTDAENLTPLTQTANKQHAVYEGRIKSMLIIANRVRRYNKHNDYMMGVRYRVVVSAASFGNFAPYSLAPSHIAVSARLAKFHIATATVTDMTDAEMTALPGVVAADYVYLRNTFNNVQIDNDDDHLEECSNPNCMH